MATHSRILAWRIPRTEEPGRLQSRGLQRVRHNLTTEHACTRKLKITFVAHLVCIVYIYVKQNCSRVVVVVQSLSRVQLLRPHRLQPARFLGPWDSPGKNTGVGCHSLLQRIFLTQKLSQVSCITGGFFTDSLPTELQGKGGTQMGMILPALKRHWWGWFSHSVVSNPCKPVDYSPPDSSVREIFQAIILEWVAISYSRGSSQPREQTWVSHIAGRFFII